MRQVSRDTLQVHPWKLSAPIHGRRRSRLTYLTSSSSVTLNSYNASSLTSRVLPSECYLARPDPLPRALKQALTMFDFIGTQLAECDQKIELQLQSLQAHEGEPAKGKKRGRARNAPKFDLRTQLFKMCGVDLTRIDGIDVSTALAVISEVGADMSRFPSGKHFASWLGLCPGTKISGGRVLSGRTKCCANRAAQALRLAAAALRSSQSALGAYFRRLCSRMDKAKAVTAAAHKLARLIYTMLTKGEEYTDQGEAYYEERYHDRIVKQLAQRAEKMGMKLVAAEACA